MTIKVVTTPPSTLTMREALRDWCLELLLSKSAYVSPRTVSSRLQDVRLDTRTLSLPPELQKLLKTADEREKSRIALGDQDERGFPIREVFEIAGRVIDPLG